MMTLVPRKLFGTRMTHQRHVKRRVGHPGHRRRRRLRGRRDVTSPRAIQLLYLSGHPFHLTNQRSF